MFSDNLEQIEKLVKMVSESDIGELSVKEGNLEITVRKKARQRGHHGKCNMPPFPPAPNYMTYVPPVPFGYDIRIPSQPFMGTPQQMPEPCTVSKQGIVAEEKEQIPDGNKVESPLVGTFYAASSPDAEPFVTKGDTVKKGQVLGIVEAMKLMNEIECEFDGVVADILVKNGDMVEYGQPLFIIQ